MYANIEKTKEYYDGFSPCDCFDCKNYYRQIEKVYPDICSFLKENGIDPLKPNELLSLSKRDKIEYFECWYVVYGECIEKDICDINNIHISKIQKEHTNIELDDECFVISFGPIELENLIKKDFALLDEMIEYYNYLGNDFSSRGGDYFFYIVDYVSTLEDRGYIIRKDNIDKKIIYLKSIMVNDGPEYAMIINFSNCYGAKYEIGVCVRGMPLIRNCNKKRLSKNKRNVLLIINMGVFFILLFIIIFISSLIENSFNALIFFTGTAFSLAILSIINSLLITKKTSNKVNRIIKMPLVEEIEVFKRDLLNFNYATAIDNLKRSYLIKKLSLSSEFSDLGIFYSSTLQFKDDEIKKLLLQLDLSNELKSFIDKVILNKKSSKSIYSFEPELHEYNKDIYNRVYLLRPNNKVDNNEYIYSMDKHTKYAVIERKQLNDFIVVEYKYNSFYGCFLEDNLSSMFGEKESAIDYCKVLVKECNILIDEKSYFELTDFKDNTDAIWNLYSNGELEEPYNTLAEYMGGINGEGHCGYFFNHEYELDKIEKNLSMLLTEKQLEIFTTALDAYKTDKNGCLEERCYECDMYYYENEDGYLSILRKYKI